MDFVDMHIRTHVVLKDGTWAAAEVEPRVSFGRTTPALLRDTRPTFLSATVPKPFVKLYAADYFWRLLAANLHSEPAVLFHLEALLTAIRSVTFVLQKECAAIPGFNEWYDEKRGEMGRNPVLKVLKELRNKSEKEGLNPPQIEFAVIVRIHNDGTTEGGFSFERFCIDGWTIANPVAELQRALNYLAQLLAEAQERRFLEPGSRAPSSWRMEVFREDAHGTWNYENSHESATFRGRAREVSTMAVVAIPVKYPVLPPESGPDSSYRKLPRL